MDESQPGASSEDDRLSRSTDLRRDTDTSPWRTRPILDTGKKQYDFKQTPYRWDRLFIGSEDKDSGVNSKAHTGRKEEPSAIRPSRPQISYGWPDRYARERAAYIAFRPILYNLFWRISSLLRKSVLIRFYLASAVLL